MKYRVKHITDYIYDNPSALCHNLMYQIPRELPFQQVRTTRHTISPNPSYEVTREDFFENKYLYFSIEQSHKKLTVTSESTVFLSKPNWMLCNPSLTQPWEEVYNWLHSTKAFNDIRQYYLESKHVNFIDGLREYTLQSFYPGRPIMEAMIELNTRINQDFEFTSGFTDISTPLEDVFKHKKGVCQDFSHFGLACVRSIGLAGRYISGYIETIAPPGEEKMVGADASHAWMALYIPGQDWVEFDATNNLLVSDQHIRVAVGRDFADVTPLKGIIYSTGKQKMKVTVDVNRMT
ncbi:MAG: transglutaminase-like putative cysteine protease [Cyclobacteriaceae bacterium]|jgi:transglutaminase-like putative cysteine protease